MLGVLPTTEARIVRLQKKFGAIHMTFWIENFLVQPELKNWVWLRREQHHWGKIFWEMFFQDQHRNGPWRGKAGSTVLKSFLRWYWFGQQESCKAGGITRRNWGSAWARIRVAEEGLQVPYFVLWSASLLFCQYVLSLWLRSLAWSQATDAFLFLLFPAT